MLVIYDMGVVFNVIDCVVVMYCGDLVEFGLIVKVFGIFEYFYICSLILVVLCFDCKFDCFFLVSYIEEVKEFKLLDVKSYWLGQS